MLFLLSNLWVFRYLAFVYQHPMTSMIKNMAKTAVPITAVITISPRQDRGSIIILGSRITPKLVRLCLYRTVSKQYQFHTKMRSSGRNYQLQSFGKRTWYIDLFDLYLEPKLFQSSGTTAVVFLKMNTSCDSFPVCMV